MHSGRLVGGVGLLSFGYNVSLDLGGEMDL